jgi:site-specific DNA-cytosine methylase
MRKASPRHEQEDLAVEREDAMRLVDWFLQLALTSGNSSWTMEQVADKTVIEHIDALKRRHPLKADWIVVDAADYEVPQHRKRIIAGSPFLITNLRFFNSRNKRKLCVRDVIPDPPREFVRNALYKTSDPQTGENVEAPLRNKLRSVDEPSFTILATGHIKWADKNAGVLRLLTAKERSLIQSFPKTYRLPQRSADALIGVGNAVPPRLAEILMSPK